MKRSLNDVTVSVRCTKAERRAFRKAAKLTRRTLSAFMSWAARLAMDTSPSLHGRGASESPQSSPDAPKSEPGRVEAAAVQTAASPEIETKE
jgi:hypothetical protein